MYSRLVRLMYRTGLTEKLIARRQHHNRCTVLLYHGVRPRAGEFGTAQFVEPPAFERQMRYIRRRYNVLSLNRLTSCLSEEGPLPKMSAAVTFDDGYQNNITIAYPILKRYGIPFTIFTTTDFLDGKQQPWWERFQYVLDNCGAVIKLRIQGGTHRCDLRSLQGKARTFRFFKALMTRSNRGEQETLLTALEDMTSLKGSATEPFMSWRETASLARDSIAEIGSHGVSHTTIARQRIEEVRHEVVESKRIIEMNINNGVTSFAFPNGQRGDFSSEAIGELRLARYRCAATGIEGFVSPGNSVFELRRVWIERDDDWPMFCAKLAGLNALVRSTRDRLLSR